MNLTEFIVYLFQSLLRTQSMVHLQTDSGYKIALFSGEIQRREAVVLRPSKPEIGFFDTVNPVLIYRTRNKNRGVKQSNLFPVSAGNDQRMSTMRPNPYLSAGIDERRSYRGLLQFNSRPN